MPDVSSEFQVVSATSNDSRFPSNHILDGKADTFWATTGLFPQSFVIKLGKLTAINGINFHSYNVKELNIEKSIKEDPVEFEEVYQTVLDHTEGTLQKKSIALESDEARFLKFIIKSGYDHFSAVHKVIINN